MSLESTIKLNTNALLDSIEHGTCFRKQVQYVECTIGNGALLRVFTNPDKTIVVYLKQRPITNLVVATRLRDAIVNRMREIDEDAITAETQRIIDETTQESVAKAAAELLLRKKEIRALVDDDFREQREALIKIEYDKFKAPAFFKSGES